MPDYCNLFCQVHLEGTSEENSSLPWRSRQEENGGNSNPRTRIASRVKLREALHKAPRGKVENFPQLTSVDQRMWPCYRLPKILWLKSSTQSLLPFSSMHEPPPLSRRRTFLGLLESESGHGLCPGKYSYIWNPGAKSTRVSICLLFFSH